jgi:hypothetical protein
MPRPKKQDVTKETMEKIGKVTTEHGVRIDGFIPFLNKVDKLTESLEQIRRSMYFMEDRQKKLMEILEKHFKNN